MMTREKITNMVISLFFEVIYDLNLLELALPLDTVSERQNAILLMIR
jgi:hypothetical protein